MTGAGLEDPDNIRALLTLATEGLAGEIVQGTEQDRAALALGKLAGRKLATLVLVCRGDLRTYAWPAEYERAIADYARATAGGATVDARTSPPEGGGR